MPRIGLDRFRLARVEAGEKAGDFGFVWISNLRRSDHLLPGRSLGSIIREAALSFDDIGQVLGGNKPMSVNQDRGQGPTVFILDVDGVLTTGQFLYSSEGKVLKVFGPDDNDGLSLLKRFIDIRFVTGDKKGYPISKRRIVDDMGMPLDIVSTIQRLKWIAEKYPLHSVIYMGDGIFDHYVMRHVGYSIAPANADRMAKKYANYVTERVAGDRAVAEACLHIMEKFFDPYDPTKMPEGGVKLSREWGI